MNSQLYIGIAIAAVIVVAIGLAMAALDGRVGEQQPSDAAPSAQTEPAAQRRADRGNTRRRRKHGR